MALDTLQHFNMSALFARRPVQLPKFEVSFFVGLLLRKLLTGRLTVERLCLCTVSRSPVSAGGVVYSSRRRVALFVECYFGVERSRTLRFLHSVSKL